MCECNICCKIMQKNSLKFAYIQLQTCQRDSYTIIATLEEMYNMLETYKCIPETCLLERIKWVHDHIKPKDFRLYDQEKVRVDMLLEELKVLVYA